MRLVARDSLKAVPWKNGSGVTRQIACAPETSDLTDFDWRISTAEVAADGPFSRFDGVDRWLAILDGAGLDLRFGDGSTRRLLPGAQLEFPGEAEVHGALLAGPVSDLNIMVRRGRQRLRVEALHINGAQDITLPSPMAAVFVLAGSLRAGTVTAQRHDTLLGAHGEGRFAVSGQAEVLVIGFTPAGRTA